MHPDSQFFIWVLSPPPPPWKLLRSPLYPLCSHRAASRVLAWGFFHSLFLNTWCTFSVWKHMSSGTFSFIIGIFLYSICLIFTPLELLIWQIVDFLDQSPHFFYLLSFVFCFVLCRFPQIASNLHIAAFFFNHILISKAVFILRFFFFFLIASNSCFLDVIFFIFPKGYWLWF